MSYSEKRFSVLGDSISTFHGVTVSDPLTFYTRSMCKKGGLTDADDTWWMQVINALGGVLDRNNSFSGSCITDGYGFGRGACTPERISALGTPDVILIFMGANDVGFNVPESAFTEAYALMLSRLHEYHPAAEIWCGTLINGKKVLDSEPFFMGEDPATPTEPFSSHIRRLAAEAGARIADLSKYDTLYDAIDGAHPTKSGMTEIASLWLREMSRH